MILWDPLLIRNVAPHSTLLFILRTHISMIPKAREIVAPAASFSARAVRSHMGSGEAKS
jgi:hypothetical protein